MIIVLSVSILIVLKFALSRIDEGDNMLVINPDECIDCGVCEPECPVDAIQSDSEPEAEKWLELNREMSEIWPNITMKLDAPPDADDYREVKDKYEKFFSNEPGNPEK